MAKTASVGLSFKLGQCYVGHSLPKAPADPPRAGASLSGVGRSRRSERTRPSVALTARAMKGDREKCPVAGASDYLARPANTEQLLSSLRIWLHRRTEGDHDLE